MNLNKNTRKLIADLATLSGVLDDLDQFGGLEQAIGERTAKIAALDTEFEQAKKDMTAAIERAKKEAAETQAAAAATLNGLTAERDKLSAEVAEADAELAALQVKIADAEAKLKVTQDALASIAANIGG